MKAAVLYEVNKPLVIEDVSLPKPGPREVLIRTSVAGLCHSDLHFMEGLYPHPLPAVLGHESAGVVEQVGSDVTYVKPGDHVVTCLSVFCGTCDNCTTGRTVLCTDTTVKAAAGRPPTACNGRAPRSCISSSISRPSPSRCWCTRTRSSKSGRRCRSISPR
jgi:S-(hydroxymethyl)glutathione dehydrogenase/alcohol dehydrogenase